MLTIDEESVTSIRGPLNTSTAEGLPPQLALPAESHPLGSPVHVQERADGYCGKVANALIDSVAVGANGN
jgi:hypothetical protein